MDDYPLNCVNCGKQNIVFEDDPFNVGCEYGDHPVRIKKEKENMPEIMTKQAQSIENPNTPPDVQSAVLPVPPKPDTSGMNKFKVNMTLHKYYEENAPAILADEKRLGDKPTGKRWGFSDYGWGLFRARHGLPVRNNKKFEKVAVKAEAPIKKVRQYHRKKSEPIEPLKPPPAPEPKKGDFSKPKSTAVDNSNLPVKFPAFNEGWTDEVKIAWLKSFVELCHINAPRGNVFTSIFKFIKTSGKN